MLLLIPSPRAASPSRWPLIFARALDADPPPPRATRWRGRLTYDGESLHGSQPQPRHRTAGGLLSAALSTRFASPVDVVCASRTDHGVHARGQAVHFDVPLSAPPPHADALQRSINGLLPEDVRLAELEEAPEVDARGRPWHAMLWATGKLYSYRLHSGGELDPLSRRQRYFSGRRPLDIDRMAAAASHLSGTIDCAALANRRSGESLPLLWPAAATTRAVRSVALVDEGGGRLRVDVHVHSALYKMVRNMVGLLLLAGRGRIAPDEVPALLAARDRARLPPPAPAHGLTLECVYYSHGWGGRYDHPLHPPRQWGGAADATEGECGGEAEG
ncbi:hypothetical protein AB1Y20_004427 [Prymnesium parvum]|uniref:tRNA pseudouridine synthase n=1 Tax=Prymnesium parvum TaxID=97485 RepID=A0AB34IYS2_PRYPA